MKNTLNLTLTANIAVLAIASGGVAQAATINIDFEDPGVAVPSGGVVDAGKTVTSRGFTLTSPLNTGFNDELQLLNDFPDPEVPSNGSTVISIRDGDRTGTTNNIISLTRQGGGLFALSSLDIAEDRGTDDYARTVNVIGNLFGGGTVTATITLDGIFDGVGGVVDDFQPFTFDASWINLTSVTFQGFGSPGDPLFGDITGLDAFALDNLNVTVDNAPPPPTTVPESSPVLSLILLGTLGALATLKPKNI